VSAYSIVGLEDVALWHERDISHSSAERVVLPDSEHCTDYMLQKMTSLVEGLVVYPRRMMENLQATRGSISADSCCGPTRGGRSRGASHEWVQRNAMKAWDEGGNLQTLVPPIRTFRHTIARPDRSAFFLIPTCGASGRFLRGCFSEAVNHGRCSPEVRASSMIDCGLLVGELLRHVSDHGQLEVITS